MNKTEYLTQLHQILNLATLVHQLEIQPVLEAITHADTIGPVLHPTTWLKSATSLDCQRRIVAAALQFQQAIQQIASDPTYSQPTGAKQ